MMLITGLISSVGDPLNNVILTSFIAVGIMVCVVKTHFKRIISV